MARIQSPFVVVEAEVSVWHAWADGIAVAGPLVRHRELVSGFRTGLKMSQVDDGAAAGVSAFGEWRVNGPRPVGGGSGWLVEFDSALGAVWDEGQQGAAVMMSGAPVVLVVRFRDRSRGGLWRVFQFSDAVLLPLDARDDAQRMMRGMRFSAGWMDEFKSGVMPGMEPRLLGVVEWRHAGRAVRAWEYDPVANAWQEDPENVIVVDGETRRYVDLVVDGEDASLAMLAAVTGEGVLAGASAVVVGWMDVAVFSSGPGGLELAPGWAVEADGCAEPLLLPPSGRHWEHPRVVVRVAGRIYATLSAGVMAVPDLQMGDPGEMLDLPVRMGAMRFYPEGVWIH